MLADAGSVARMAGDLLDDPSNSIYTLPYLMPKIDLAYSMLDVELESCGMQYVEAIVVFPVPANTLDLSPLLASGQPLATMKLPTNVKWRLPSEPDYQFKPSSFANMIAEVDTSVSFGALQWAFIGGALQVTPSSADMILKVYFEQMSTSVYDPVQGVVRGTSHILAHDVAILCCGARKGMEKRKVDLKMDRKAAWNQFKNVLTKNNQGKPIVARPLHPRMGVPTPFVPAPTSAIDDGA